MFDSTQMEFVLEIAFALPDKLGGGFHVMLAVEYCLLKLVLRQRMVDIEIHGGFLHRHSKVSLDGF